MNPVQRVFIHVKIKYKILANGAFLDLVVVDVHYNTTHNIRKVVREDVLVRT